MFTSAGRLKTRQVAGAKVGGFVLQLAAHRRPVSRQSREHLSVVGSLAHHSTVHRFEAVALRLPTGADR